MDGEVITHRVAVPYAINRLGPLIDHLQNLQRRGIPPTAMLDEPLDRDPIGTRFALVWTTRAELQPESG